MEVKKSGLRKPLPFNVKTACSKGNKPIKFYKVMEIIPKNNTFENTQITSFLNKLDALIASGYADADDYSALIQCCLNVENAPENQRQVAADVVNVLRIFKIELLANNSQKEFALQKFGKHLNNANLPIDIIKLLTVLFCKVFKTISADIAFKLLQEQFLNFNESDWQNFKTQYKDNAERNNFKDADFSTDLHLIQNYFENFQQISANQFQQINAPAKQVANDAVTAFEAKRERNVVAITSEKISQAELATGTHDNLPTQIQISKITIAEADATATAKQNYQLKGDAQKFAKERNMLSENFTTNSNLTTNNNNAENDTNVATDATNSASNIKTPPAKTHAKNQSKAVTAKYHKKDYSGYIYAPDPVAEFESILTAYGLIVNKILIENKICRVGTSNNPKGDAGWLKYHTSIFYTSNGEELIYLHGVFGNWASGEGTQFVNITNYDFENRNDSAEYLKEMQKIRKQAEKKRAEQVAELEKEIQAEYNKTAEKATQFYNEICDFYNYEKFPIEDPHEYLKNKNLFVELPPEIKVINSQKADAYFSYRLAGKGGKLADGEWLVIPIYNKAKNGVRTLQFIDITGNKTTLKGGEAGGGYFEIESNNKTDNYAIVEGVADALALSQVLTNFNVVVAFFATNIIKVVGELVKANSNAKITIFADNDKESKTGEIQAEKAVEAHGGKYIMPPAEYKDFCDFWTAEFANNNGNINAVISNMQNYITQALKNKNVKKYRFIQKETKRVMSVDRAKTKNENEVGKIKATTQNVIEALQNREYCGFEFILEERSQNIEVIDYVEYSKDADGNEEMYFNEDGKQPRPLTELDYLEIKSRIEYHPKNNPTGFEEISINKILRGAVEFVARKKSYDKIQNFIDNLPKLNGEALQKAIYKLENLFIYYANADVERFPSEYYKAVARCFMTEIIARCLTKTGCKADYVPILQGKQGAKKSQFCLSLINDPSLIADVDFDNKTDDIIRKISGKVIGVIDEMNGFGKKQASFVKKFITFTHDTYIPKYKEFEKVVTRSVVFIGTTNEEQFLNDATGERRYYPIPIKDGAETRYLELKRDILEIYAAALHLYNEDLKIGTEITADGKEVEHNGVLFHNLESWNKQATKEFKLENPYITNIDRWLNTTYKHNEYIKSPDYFVAGEKPYKFEYLLTVDVAMFALDITKDKYNIHTHGKNIKAALVELGYKNITKRINGKPCKVFVNTNTNLNNYNSGNNNNNDADDNIPF